MSWYPKIPTPVLCRNSRVSPPTRRGPRRCYFLGEQDVARRVIDAGAGLGLSGLPTGNISSGDIREAVADIVSDPSYGGSAAVLSGVLR